MPLETATYIHDLVVSNPASSDGMNNADDHMRMIKAAVKNTFPGGSGPMTNADGGFLAITDGAPSTPAYSFTSEPTLGFYREAAGVLTLVGGRLKNAAPVGSLHEFLVEPTGLGKAATGSGHEYLELDGSTWPNASFPALATHLGQGGTTFTLPDAKTTGRFTRSRTASVTAGTAQANTVGPHTHPDQAITTGNESVGHTHTFSGTTGNDSPDHTHGYTGPALGGGTGSTPNYFYSSIAGANTGGASTRHQHPFSGTTAGASVPHTHSATVATPANTGTTETRPEALSVVKCIKT